jgi:hypothetical protein
MERVVYNNVDLYDYFSNGIFPNVYLRDQDVVLVKPYQIETELGYWVQAIGTYLKSKKMKLLCLDLINIAGGASSNAFKECNYSLRDLMIFQNQF